MASTIPANAVLAIPTSAVAALADGFLDSTLAQLRDIEDIPLLAEANRRLGALKHYVQRKEDRDDVAFAEIECRSFIGGLLGPNPDRGGDRHSEAFKSSADDLSKSERYEFRLLSIHSDIKDELLAGGERRFRPIINEIKRRMRPTVEPTIPEHIDIRHCAVSELEIEPGTVDMIFTDPPYGVEHLEAWEGLGVFAKYALKPGGILVAYSGQWTLPEAMYALSDLDYVWMGAVVHDGPFFQLRRHKIQVGWKPLLIYGQPPVEIESWWTDTITDGRREKDYHGWQQAEAEAAAMIEAFTVPGELVVDPFLGGGTTAAAASSTSRAFLGCDIDAEAVAKSKERIHIEA